MRIGIFTRLGSNSVMRFFKEEDKKTLAENLNAIGGPAVNTLIVAFLAKGHFVRIFTFSVNDFYVKGENIEVIGVNTNNNYFIKYTIGCFVDAFRMRRAIKPFIADLDILHAHWTYGEAWAASKYIYIKPVLCTIRDWTPLIWKFESAKNKITWFFRILLNEMVMKQKKVIFIANSPYTENLAKRKMRKEIPMIPNPISPTFLKNDKHINPKTFTVLCISSSNDKRKNIPALLKGFQLFREKVPVCCLNLIGGPFTSESECCKEWREQGLLIGVDLLGLQSHKNLKSFLDECSIFITPSLEETFGNTLIEAFARRIPVIGGRNSGAVPYVLGYGKYGYLCDVSNPQSIAASLYEAFLHQDEAISIGEKAYEYVKKRYLAETICDEHIDLYRNTITSYNEY